MARTQLVFLRWWGSWKESVFLCLFGNCGKLINSLNSIGCDHVTLQFLSQSLNLPVSSMKAQLAQVKPQDVKVKQIDATFAQPPTFPGSSGAVPFRWSVLWPVWPQSCWQLCRRTSFWKECWDRILWEFGAKICNMPHMLLNQSFDMFVFSSLAIHQMQDLDRRNLMKQDVPIC